MIRNEWTLQIKDFGKIKSASITVSPFMMFVGHNNSGKSYIMELLWGLLVKAEDYSSKIDVTVIDEFTKKIHPDMNIDEEIVIDEKMQKRLISEWNKILQQEKERLVHRIFQHELTVHTIAIERTSYLPISLSWSVEKRLFGEEDEKELLRYKIRVGDHIYESLGGVVDDHGEIKKLLINNAIKSLFIMQLHYSYLGTGRVYAGKDESKRPLYFPASRTGFMQTYKAIVGNLINKKDDLFIYDDREKSSEMIGGTTLTWPTNDYLVKLVKMTDDREAEKKYQSELKFLKQNVLKGSVQKTELGQFEFMAENSQSLPLHVTSSLISELAPLYLFLQSSNQTRLWMIEEIESHLHPKMQIEIARFLMRLTHSGLNIWMTTHSDNIISVINNMMVLAQKENQQELLDKLNWHKTDLPLAISDVKLYQFQSTESGTEIKEVPLGEGGFEVETFNDTLDELIENTVIIQNDGD